MELEVLVMSLEEEYEICFPAGFGESKPTLGEVFAFLTKSHNKDIQGDLNSGR